MKEHIERIGRKLVYKGSILDVYQDHMKAPNGKEEMWDFVSHRMGAACVLPVLEDGKILLVRQYRPALNRETIEVPAGCRDNVSEDTKICAQREMEEETGYCCNHIEKLLSLKSTVAFCDESIDVYLATELKPSKTNLDDMESIDVEIYELSELEEMIYSGKIQDAKTVAAIMAYANKIHR